MGTKVAKNWGIGRIRYIAVLLCALLPASALAETYKAEWTDPNYVPCEGVGLTGSGRISIQIEYQHLPGKPARKVIEPITGNDLGMLSADPHEDRIKSVVITTRYDHPVDQTGSIGYTGPDGKARNHPLTRPWYAVLKDASVSSILVGKRFVAPNGEARNWQEWMFIKGGSTLKLQLSTRYPQNGGSCVSSFTKEFTVD